MASKPKKISLEIRHSPSGWNVYEDGQFVLGNRKTLREAQRDAIKFGNRGGRKATISVKYKGDTIKLRSHGGFYPSVSMIDRGIRNVVLELNRRGFTTIASCSGHLKKGIKRGFITFDKDITITAIKGLEIKRVLSKFGLKNFRIGKHMVRFDAIG
jgi:hypothetical protein